MHGFRTALLVTLMALSFGVAGAEPAGVLLRFSDILPSHLPATNNHQMFRLSDRLDGPDAPLAAANGWLERDGWQQVWPRLLLFGQRQALFFAGPVDQRYLAFNTEKAYYIWSRPLNVDPQQYPILEISWGIERFPDQAALDVYERNDRPLVIMVSFGPKVSSAGLMPDVPRALAFFWDETATVGKGYTCIPPRHGPDDVRMQCNYPHVRYVALRNGGAGTVHTDPVNLLEHFRQQFPGYWQQHQRVPPVVAVSIEARSDRTGSTSSARLYALAFTTEVQSNGHLPAPAQEGK